MILTEILIYLLLHILCHGPIHSGLTSFSCTTLASWLCDHLHLNKFNQVNAVHKNFNKEKVKTCLNLYMLIVYHYKCLVHKVYLMPTQNRSVLPTSSRKLTKRTLACVHSCMNVHTASTSVVIKPFIRTFLS